MLIKDIFTSSVQDSKHQWGIIYFIYTSSNYNDVILHIHCIDVTLSFMSGQRSFQIFVSTIHQLYHDSVKPDIFVMFYLTNDSYYWRPNTTSIQNVIMQMSILINNFAEVRIDHQENLKRKIRPNNRCFDVYYFWSINKTDHEKLIYCQTHAIGIDKSWLVFKV